MNGSITEHVARDGRIRFRVRVTVAGRRVSLGLFDTREDAEDALRAHDELHRDEPRGLTVVALGERWLDRRELDRDHHRAAAKDRSRWKKHVATAPFATKLVRSVEPQDVRHWVRNRLAHLATQSQRNALFLVSAFYRDAIEDGFATSNPCRDVRVKPKPRRDQTWTYLTPKEIDLVASKVTDPFARTVFAVAIYTGLREGELWGLRWEDVRLEEGRIDVCRSYDGPTKGGRVRHVPLLLQARAALGAWRRARPGVGSALVFPGPSGGCWHREYDADWADRKAGKGDAARVTPGWKTTIGISRRVRFHDMRHTCASHLVMGTWGQVWTLQEVQQWLGHASIVTTERYAHLAPDSIVAKARGRSTDTGRTPAVRDLKPENRRNAPKPRQ